MPRPALTELARIATAYEQIVDAGKTIRTAREECGVTQSSLARRIGVHQSLLSRWESGALAPERGQILTILRELRGLAIIPPEIDRDEHTPSAE